MQAEQVAVAAGGAVAGAAAALFCRPCTTSAVGTPTPLEAARRAFGAEGGAVVLRNASLQLETLSPGLELQGLPSVEPLDALPPADPDAPGLVRADLCFAGGVLTAVAAPGTALSALTLPAGSAGAAEVDLAGRMIWPCLVDAHTHMVKTNTMPRCSNPSCTMSDALQVEVCDRPRWSRDDMSTRLDFSLRCAYAHGTAAMRTHLDGVQCDNPTLTADTYAAFDSARAEWAGRIVLQGVANLFLPLWADPAIADKHVEEALRHDGVILGAYCGMNMKDSAVEAWFDALFAQAAKADLPVDLHIDETDDVSGGCSLLAAAGSLAKARAAGYRQPVVCGHCTSASLLPRGDLEQVIAAVAAAGDVTVCMNPLTNTSLQDRRGQAASVGTVIPRDVPRTPCWRGITAVQVRTSRFSCTCPSALSACCATAA